MTPTKDSGNYMYERRAVEGRKRIYAYVEAVRYLLNAYATNGVVAKTAAEFKAL